MATWAFVGTDPRTHNFYLPVCSLLVHVPRAVSAPHVFQEVLDKEVGATYIPQVPLIIYEQPVHSIAVECAERLGRRLSSHAFIRGRLCAQHHPSRSCARPHQLVAWVQLNAFSNVGESRSGNSYLTTARYYRDSWSRLQLGSGSDMLVALSAVQAKTGCAHVPDAGNGGRLFLSRSLGRLGPWGRLQPGVHVPRCAEGRSLCGVGDRIRASSVVHVLHGREIGGMGTQ